MPSLVVHVALGLVLGAALLGRGFTWRAALAVLVVTVLPDLDALAGLYIPGAHRALLHTLVVPLALAAALLVDTHLRREGVVAGRFGARGVRLAWACVLVYVLAGIGLDLTNGGVNVLYPVHDQFYELDGAIAYSTERGLVQTFTLPPGAEPGTIAGTIYVASDADTEDGGASGFGSSDEVHVGSAIDPTPGPESPGTERVFPLVRSGWELLLLVSGVVVLAGRRLLRTYGTVRPEVVTPDPAD
ncbi:metal-dependent hydrolase [Halomarina ordinaria]|uniref:Metal-dependent hydrolase n=1 Tax=Halomarina ordinaria TaxID=3033939 RepID=A0ABD5UBB1_9EURY|nr:metal-dependent hydrolase [Halomarina sp. PSRA2]